MIDRLRLRWLSGAALLLLALPAGAQDAPAPAPPAPPPVAGGEAPPPLPAPAPFAVYVAVAGQQTGPYDEAGLKELIRTGKLNAQTLVWEKGMAAWGPADTLPKVNALIAAVGGPPAMPFDCTAYFTGTWERTEMIAGQQMVTQSLFAAGGQFTGVQTAMGLPGSQFYGTWKANAVGPKACSLTLDFQYPYTSQSVTVFTIVDNGTITQQGSPAQIRRVQ